MSVIQYTGAMGAGKTFSAVQQVVLPNLKKGRIVVTNVTGLDHEKIAKFLGLELDDIKNRLMVFDDEEINDAFWPDEQRGGKVPWGSVVVIDEAWKFVREKGHLTPRLMDFIRRHRKWAAGDPPLSCEIVFITQSKSDLHRAITTVTDQVWVVTKNRFSGLKSLYSLALYQPGQRQPLVRSNHSYDKKIFELYKSHSVDGVVEQDANDKGSFLHSRQTWLAAGAGIFALVGICWFGPKLLNGSIIPAPKTHASISKAYSNNQLSEFNSNSPPATVSGVAIAAPASTIAMSAPSSSVPSSSFMSSPGSTLPPAPDVYTRVLALKGDPDSVLAVGKAYCSRAGNCDLVVNAASQQIVLVGDQNAVERLQKLIGDLAVRPAGQLVRLIVFELDTSKEDDFNVFFGFRSGATSFNTGSQNGAGTVGILSIGRFNAGFNKLIGSGSVRLISAPSIMIWPGQESSVKSGLSVPILGSIITDQSGRQSQVVDYRDSGLILNIAQVSSGLRPVLKVDIESSSYGNSTVGVPNQPTKSQRTLSTMAELAPCGVTILGGIDQVMDQDQKQKFLGFTTNRQDSQKGSRVFVALMADGAAASAQACAAGGDSNS